MEQSKGTCFRMFAMRMIAETQLDQEEETRLPKEKGAHVRSDDVGKVNCAYCYS